MKAKFEIKSYFGSLLFSCETENMKQAVEAAVRSGADLSEANLSGANLSWANLTRANLFGANLTRANLFGADLSGANLFWADLSGANLSGADLSRANLFGADLSGANLFGADLSGANLTRANLFGADLSGANLSGANLSGADLSRANLKDATGAGLALAQSSHIPPEGPFVAWKKCRDGVLVKLGIPSSAKRSHGAGRKGRCDKAKVLEVIGANEGVSCYDGSVVYRKGKIVRCSDGKKGETAWNEDRWVECGGGIHFFLTREEAEAFSL